MANAKNVFQISVKLGISVRFAIKIFVHLDSHKTLL